MRNPPSASVASLPVQPEPVNTRLIISAEMPKSSTTSSGRPRAMASSAAVEDTVTSPRELVSAAVMAPVANPTAPGVTSPAATRSCQSTS